MQINIRVAAPAAENGNGRFIMNEKFSQSSSASTSSSYGIIRQIRCDAKDCGGAAVLRFGTHLFCLEHLVGYCHARLEVCQREISKGAMPASADPTSSNRFLEECTSRVAGFLMARPELQNIDRARLLDVLLWAAELDGKGTASGPKLSVVSGGGSDA
jgi:hypothetical protein